MEVTTIEQFYEIKENNPNDLIVIMDTPTKIDRIHYVRCHHVKDEYFQTKVLNNQRKNGSYHHYHNFEYEQIKQKYKQGIDCIACERFSREPLI